MSLLQKLFGTAPQQGPAVNPATGQPMQPMQPGQGGSVAAMGQPPMIGNDPHQPNLPKADPQNPDPTNKQEPSPMGTWADLWTMDKPKEGEPDLNTPFRFNVDEAKVKQQIGTIDFTKSITPEIMQKINAGGPEAMAAMLAAMNTMSQQVLLNATGVTRKITEAGLEAAGTRLESKIPTLVRNQSISNALREDNPLFTNPATAPMLDAIAAQMAAKFPNATPQDIREKSKQYLVDFAKETHSVFKVEPDGSPKKPATSNETDWSTEPIL